MTRRTQHDWVLYLHWLKSQIPPNHCLLQMVRQENVFRSFFFAYVATFIISPNFFCSLFVFWENFTLQLINLKSEQDSKTFALRRIVQRPNPEEHWLQPCFSCRASACASVSQHAALLSCRLHSTKTFVSELYFQPEPTFAPQTRQLQGLCLTFGKEFAAQHIIKKFASRPFSPNAFPFTSILILNAPMQLQDI